MSKWQRRLSLALALLALAAAPARAQLTVQITRGVTAPIPVAVVPFGSTATLPVDVKRWTERIAVDAPIFSRRAASRALSPSAKDAITRVRRSSEYPLAIPFPVTTDRAAQI